MKHRVVGRFLSSRLHPKSRRLFPFYFSNITHRTDLHVLTFGVTGAVFKIAGEMHWLPAYFDNPDTIVYLFIFLSLCEHCDWLVSFGCPRDIINILLNFPRSVL